MKITDYRTYTLSTGWRNLTYLVVETDEGLRGFGEAHIVGRTHTVREYLKDIRHHIIGHDPFNIVQPDISQCGGLLEVKKICSTAETLSMMAAPHNVGGIIATTANVHLMATLRNGKILEHFNDFADSYVKQAGAPYPEVVDGYFTLPEGPGWGVELDMDFLEANEPETEDGVILDPGLNMFKSSTWNRRSRNRDGMA